MSKQKESALVQVIKCLTQAEKRHFKLMARRNNGEKEALFIKMFDFIDKHADSKEVDIVQKIPELKRSQIANIRSNLYKQLLTSLRLYHRNHNRDIFLSEQMDYAKVLYDKGLYKSSLEILNKAKKTALSQKQYLMAQNLVEFEKHIESQHITGSMSAKAEELSKQSSFLTQRNKKTSELSSASIQLYGLYLKIGYVRNQKDYDFVTNYFQKSIPQYDIKDLEFYEKMYLFQSHVWYYNMVHDFLNYYKFAQKWVNLFHENEIMKVKETSSYIKSLHNVLNALFLTGKYDKFVSIYQEMLNFKNQKRLELNRNESSQLLMFQNIHRINLHYMEGSFSKGLEHLPRLESFLENNIYNWDIHRIMVFYYKIACLYFGAGENEKAIHFLNMIINNYIPQVREDIQSFARILNLIAHFELGNKLLISYQIKSVFRFLSKMEDLHAVQLEILKFLRKTPRIKPEDLNEEFALLKEKLEQIQKLQFEKRPFFYLDIISWLESKIDGIIVEKVIERKFEKFHTKQLQ